MRRQVGFPEVMGVAVGADDLAHCGLLFGIHL